MKPLPVLTEEDWCIWLRLRVWGACFETSLISDRRDAELMLEWQLDKEMLAYADIARRCLKADLRGL